MDKSIRIYKTPFELAEKFAENLAGLISESCKSGTSFSVALAGGSTPELVYSVIGDHFSKTICWDEVHFFWGDERCVSQDSEESNYGMTRRSLLRKINIPSSNIHMINGDNEPETEASRYSAEIKRYTRTREGLPVFDLIILGLGEDGHTASIFNTDSGLLDSDQICAVASHPVTLQKRITITGRVINNADIVNFIVTGNRKAGIVEKILKKGPDAQNFPASRIVPVHGELFWFLDSESACLL
jgi:6-phosphogluconolactonase